MPDGANHIHDWRYIRETVGTEKEPRDERTYYLIVEHADLYYCSRCLKYNEVVTRRKKSVVEKYFPPTPSPPWGERLYIWWYNLTNKHSAKEAHRS